MLTYKGGNQVGKGTYWDLANGRRIDVATEAVLAGGGTVKYVRMPAAVMLLSGPFIGLLYAVLLPIIGIAAALAAAAGKVLAGIYHLAGRSVSFDWSPGNAYLAGKKKEKKDSK